MGRTPWRYLWTDFMKTASTPARWNPTQRGFGHRPPGRRRGVRPSGRPGGNHRPENHQGDEDRRRRGDREDPQALSRPGPARVPRLRPVRRVRLPAPDVPRGAVGQAPAGPGRPDPPGGADIRVEEILGAKNPSTTATRASTPWARTAPSASTGPGPIRWCR